MVVKKKTGGNIAVVGTSVVYIQSIGANHKLGKAKPFVLSVVRKTAPAPVASKRVRKSK